MRACQRLRIGGVDVPRFHAALARRRASALLGVADEDVVVAAVDEQPRDHAADLAAAEQKDAMHGVSLLRPGKGV